MRVPFRTSILAMAVATAVGVALAAPAAAEAPIVKIARNKSGPYSIVANVNTSTSRAKVAWVKAKGNDGTAEEVALTEFESAVGHSAKYFKGKSNITDEVLAHGGYLFTLSPDKAKLFKVKIKATDAPPPSACLGVGVSNEDGSGVVYASLNGVPC